MQHFFSITQLTSSIKKNANSNYFHFSNLKTKMVIPEALFLQGPVVLPAISFNGATMHLVSNQFGSNYPA